MRFPSLLAALCIAWSTSVCAAGVCTRNLPSLKGQWQEHRQDEFIVQFARTGEHALNATEVVADVATQLTAMRDMLQHLGFQLPLQSQRYQSQGASHVLVRFRKIEGANGRAFDEVSRMPSGECVLMIEVATHLRSGNLTPAHELFHLVQSGYMPFKRPWLFEGTARWAETVLGKRAVVASPVPHREEDQAALWKKSYAAVSIWYGLIRKCSSGTAAVAVPDHLRGLRYRDGSPAVVDDHVPGHDYIRQVLERLGELGDRIGEAEGVKPYRWPEKFQRDSRHDKAIWEVVQRCG